MAFNESNNWEGRGMDAPANRTLKDIQRDGKSLTEFVSIDERPSPSDHTVTDTDWSLVVRGWGIVVISATGVRLLRRADITSSVVDSFGPSWK